MTHPRAHFAAAIAAALLASATVASAQDSAVQPAAHTLGEHPAILVKRQVPHIDPNTFIVMHPAGLFVIAAPSQADAQPAVAAVPSPAPAAMSDAMAAATGMEQGEPSDALAN